ncbi:MAG: hypothetical protein IK080_03900, partial [Clostridia bacterium]|nr:hypothetical protein [Clostridia bacterium]
ADPLSEQRSNPRQKEAKYESAFGFCIELTGCTPKSYTVRFTPTRFDCIVIAFFSNNRYNIFIKQARAPAGTGATKEECI